MSSIYDDSTYLAQHPTWHNEDAAWKAERIARIIDRNGLKPRTIADIGCGSGEIICQLARRLDDQVHFHGFEPSPRAFELCTAKSGDRIKFTLGNPPDNKEPLFDIVMAIDVIEHVEDYLGFARKLKNKAPYKIFHIPLDLSLQTVLRRAPLQFVRRRYGHIHYFTKDTALASLRHVGYEIIDSFLTTTAIDIAEHGWRATLMRGPRRLAFGIHKNLAARILGGFSLMVLAK